MTLSGEQISAIDDFFSSANRLKSLGIVRTDRYLGDIAEFIAKTELGMVPAASARQEGYDGHIDGRTVQVKFNGGTSITIDCGDPETYEELVIILGPNSAMRRPEVIERYAIYRIPSSRVKMKARHKDGKLRFAKGDLPHEFLVK